MSKDDYDFIRPIIYFVIVIYFCYLGEHPDAKTMCMIISDTDTVLVYDQTKLRWSAKLSYHPCIIARASFKVLTYIIRIVDMMFSRTVFNSESSFPPKLIVVIFIKTGVTRVFGFVVGNWRFEILLPWHRTHDIYGSRKTDQ